MRVDTDGLDSGWFESKRPGFFEIGGTLEAHYSGGSRAVLTASQDAVSTSVEVRDRAQSWQIDEEKGMARRSDWLEVAGRLVYQSEMSGPMVEAILETGRCDLPSLDEASVTHRAFIRGLQAHWNRTGHAAATSVPIT